MKKTKVLILLILLTVTTTIFFTQYTFSHSDNSKKNTETITENINKVDDYNYPFFETGITNKKTTLYKYIQGKFQEIGTLEKGIYLHFSKKTDNYLLINNFDDEYYVKIEEVDNISQEENYNDRYKKYILFNENIVTNNITNFYNKNNELLFTINKSFEFAIVIKEENRYGIEYGNQLLYISKDDVLDIKENNNTNQNNSSGVAVLNYHFFYDENNEKESQECNQEICISKSQFQSEIDYLKENNILTITATELEMYIDGKINLPKSVLITIDDGYMLDLGIQMLEENEMYGCVFLITSWYDNIDFLRVYKYIEFNSHGEKLHTVGVCPGGQGGGIKCLDRNTLLDDLKKSREKLNGTTFFAYPFYEYNDYSISILKEAGITMAFAGEDYNSDSLVHVGSNKYELPRFVMVNYTTLTDLDNYFNKIK